MMKSDPEAKEQLNKENQILSGKSKLKLIKSDSE